MRVLLTNDLSPAEGGGGAERYVERLAAALEAAGDRVELFTGAVGHRGPGKVLDLWDPLGRRRLEQVARGFRPDVVHHNNVVRELSVSVLGVPRGVPQVLTVHDARLLGTPDVSVRGLRRVVDRAVKSRLDREVARRTVDAAVAVSPVLEPGLTAAGFRRVELVPPLVDRPAHPLRPPERSRDLLFAGRLAPDKGADVLVAAFAAVRARHPDARLLLAGAGPLAGRLAAAAGPGVELLGHLDADRLGALLGRVRAVVVPSVRPEACPLSALEAAWHGRALVVADQPGLVAVAERTGGLVVPAGAVHDLAVTLDRLLADDALAARCGADAAAGARAQYDPDDAVRRLRGLYRELRRPPVRLAA